jgi:hypothetical protein
VGLAAYLLARRLLRRKRLVLMAGLLLAPVPALSAPTFADGLAMAAAGLGLVLLVADGARLLLRANLAAYLGTALVAGLLFNALTLLSTSNGWLFANGLILVGVALVGLLGFVLLMLRRESGPTGRAVVATAGEGAARRIPPRPAPPLLPSQVHRS